MSTGGWAPRCWFPTSSRLACRSGARLGTTNEVPLQFRLLRFCCLYCLWCVCANCLAQSHVTRTAGTLTPWCICIDCCHSSCAQHCCFKRWATLTSNKMVCLCCRLADVADDASRAHDLSLVAAGSWLPSRQRAGWPRLAYLRAGAAYFSAATEKPSTCSLHELADF